MVRVAEDIDWACCREAGLGGPPAVSPVRIRSSGWALTRFAVLRPWWWLLLAPRELARRLPGRALRGPAQGRVAADLQRLLRRRRRIPRGLHGRLARCHFALLWHALRLGGSMYWLRRYAVSIARRRFMCGWGTINPFGLRARVQPPLLPLLLLPRLTLPVAVDEKAEEIPARFDKAHALGGRLLGDLWRAYRSNRRVGPCRVGYVQRPG